MSIRSIAPSTLVDIGLFRYSMMHLLATMALLFVTMPLVDHFTYGAQIETALISLVLLMAVFVVGGRRRSLTIGIVLVVISVSGRLVEHTVGGAWGMTISISAGIVLVAVVIFRLLQFVIRARHVNHHVISAGVCVYLLLAMLFSFAYAMVALWIPGAFLNTTSPHPEYVLRGFDAVYFSFVTLNTVGYGDIVPVTGVARMLAMLQATCGLLFVSILISRLVSLYSAEDPQKPE